MSSKLNQRNHSKVHQLVIFASMFALLGVVTIMLSNAAISPNAKVAQAEAYASAQNTTTVSDTSSSGSSYVQFDATSGGGALTCPPYPAFPDASCTGWQHTGVTLRTVPGQVSSGTGWNWEGSPFNYVKITGSGAVLDGLDISGCVFVDAGVSGATIKRSRVSGNCDYLVRLNDANAIIAMLVEDTELIGGAVQYKGAGFTWRRVNAHGFSGKAAMTQSGSTVEDSYIHDNVCNPPDHQSGIGTNGGASNIVLRHNNVDLTPSECTSGGIANYDDSGHFMTF